MIRALALAAVLAIAACAGTTEMKQWAAACDAWDRALVTLTVYHRAGRLNETQARVVDGLVPIGEAWCNVSVTDYSAALDAMERVLIDAAAVQGRVEG